MDSVTPALLTFCSRCSITLSCMQILRMRATAMRASVKLASTWVARRLVMLSCTKQISCRNGTNSLSCREREREIDN